MEFKLVILSLACFSCLVPPSQGHSLLAAKAAAVGAVKGAAVLGAGALAAKGLALKGAVVVGAKAAAAKALASKVAGVGAASVVAKPPVQVLQSTGVVSPPSLSLIKNRVTGLISTVHTAALNKKAAVSQLLLSLLPTKTVVLPPKVVEVPTIVEVPKIIEVPKVVEVEKIVEVPTFVRPPLVVPEPAPCQPSVAVVGPTMNVVYDNPEQKRSGVLMPIRRY